MFKNLKQKLENLSATSQPSKTSSMPADEGKGEEMLEQSAVVNNVKDSDQKPAVVIETSQSMTDSPNTQDLLVLTKEELEKTNRVLLSQVKDLEDSKNDLTRRLSRRIGELEEQIHLDQQAKRDLEHSYALMLDEKDELITILKMQVQLLKSNQPINTSMSEDHEEQTTEVSEVAIFPEETVVLREKVKRLESLLTKCKDTIKTNKEKSKQLMHEKEDLEKVNEEKMKEMHQKHEKEMKSKMAELQEEIRAQSEARSSLNNQLVNLNSQMSEKEKSIELKEKDFNAKMEKIQGDMERLNATFKRSQEKTMKGLKSQTSDSSTTGTSSEEAIAFDASQELDKMKELYESRGKELVQVLEDRNKLRKELNSQRQRFATVLERYDEQMKVVQGELTERMKPGPMEANLMKEVWSILSGVPYQAPPSEESEEKKESENDIKSISESDIKDLCSETVPRQDLEAAQNKLEHVLSLLERCAKQIDSREAFENRWKERLEEAESKAAEQQRISKETIDRLNDQIMELTNRENVLNANLERARQESDAILQQQRTEMVALQSNVEQLVEREQQLGLQIQRTKKMCDAEVARVTAENLESIQRLSNSFEETQSTLSGLAKELIESKERSDMLIGSLESDLNEKCSMLQRLADYIDVSNDETLKVVFYKIVVECSSPAIEEQSVTNEIENNLPSAHDIAEKSEVVVPKDALNDNEVSSIPKLSETENVSVENCKSTVVADKKEVRIESCSWKELINFDILHTNQFLVIQKNSNVNSTNTSKHSSLLNSDIITRISRRNNPSCSPVHRKSLDKSLSGSFDIGSLRTGIVKLKSNLSKSQQRYNGSEIESFSVRSMNDFMDGKILTSEDNVLENLDDTTMDIVNIEKGSYLERSSHPESSNTTEKSINKDDENRLLKNVESLQFENELLKQKVKEHEQERLTFNATSDSLKIELDTVSLEASKLKTYLLECETRLGELDSMQEKLAQSELECKCKDKENEETKERLEKINEELELERSILRNLEEEIGKNETAGLELKDLSMEYNKLQADYNFERSENQKLMERISCLEKEHKKESEAMEELFYVKENLQCELDANARCLIEQKTISEDLQFEINSLKDALDQKEISNINFSESLNNFTRDGEGLLSEKPDLFSTIENLELENNNLRNSIADLNKTLENTKFECTSHLEKVNSKESELEDVVMMRQKDEGLINEMKERHKLFEQISRDLDTSQVTLSEKVALIQKLEDNKKNQVLSLCFDNLSKAQFMLNYACTNVSFLLSEVHEQKYLKSKLENTLKETEKINMERDEVIISLREEINLLQKKIQTQNCKNLDDKTSIEPFELPLSSSSKDDSENIKNGQDIDSHPLKAEIDALNLVLTLKDKEIEEMKVSYEAMLQKYEEAQMNLSRRHVYYNDNITTFVEESTECENECKEGSPKTSEHSEVVISETRKLEKLQENIETFDNLLSAEEKTSRIVEEKIIKMKTNQCFEEPSISLALSNANQEREILLAELQQAKNLLEESRREVNFLKQREMRLSSPRCRSKSQSSLRERLDSLDLSQDIFVTPDKSSKNGICPTGGSYAGVHDHHHNLVDLSPLNQEQTSTNKVESGNEKSDSDLLELSDAQAHDSPPTARGFEYQELHKRYYLLSKEVERLNTELHFYYANSHLKHHLHHRKEEIEKHDSFLDLTESTELEYLRNVLYKYMLGTETKTLAKVICMVARFSDDQTKEILDWEESKTGIFQSRRVLEY